MIHKRLRNTVYLHMHNLNNPEHTVTNYMNAMTHTDVITAHVVVHALVRHIGSSLVRVLSHHPIHACARGCLSVLFLVSLYFFLKSFFHLFLIPAVVPDENSMEDPCATPPSGAWSAWTMSHPTQ